MGMRWDFNNYTVSLYNLLQWSAVAFLATSAMSCWTLAYRILDSIEVGVQALSVTSKWLGYSVAVFVGWGTGTGVDLFGLQLRDITAFCSCTMERWPFETVPEFSVTAAHVHLHVATTMETTFDFELGLLVITNVFTDFLLTAVTIYNNMIVINTLSHAVTVLAKSSLATRIRLIFI